MFGKQKLKNNITHKTGARKIFAIFVLVALLFVGQIPKAEAAIPKYINFQGKLTAVSNGNNVANGSYTFEFKLYTAVSGGSLLWTETWDGSPAECPQLAVAQGVFNAKLGSCNPLTGVDFTTGSLFLSVNFDDGGGFDGEMSPRKQLVSSAYAFVANGVSGDGVVNTANQSATALTVGRGATYPALQVDTNTASSETGVKVTAAAAAGGVAIAAISSGANEALTINSKGTGEISLGSSSTGNINIGSSGTGDILLGGGSGSTGCTVTNSSGAFACSAGLTGVGVNASTGLLQGQLGLTVTGAAVSLNESSNFAVNIATGTSTGTITLGGTGASQSIQIGSGVAAKTITIGNSNDDTFSLFSSGLNVSTGGAITGASGITSSGTINFSGLTASSAVYTDGSKNLTSTAPTSGAIGYWSRTGTVLDTTTANDTVLIDTTNTTGADLAITNTGIYTGTGIFNLTANSATTGTLFAQSATGLTTGVAQSITLGSALTTGSALNITGASYNPGVGNTGNLINLAFTNNATNTSGISTATGINISPTISAVGSGGSQVTYGIYLQNVAGTPGAGNQAVYGMRIGNQGISGAETSIGLYIDTQSGSSSNNTGISMNSITTGTGINMGTLSTGTTGISIGGGAGTSKSFYAVVGGITSGSGLELSNAATGSLSAYTGNIIVVNGSRTFTAGSITDTGKYLNIARDLIVNNTSGVSAFTNSGNLTELSSNCTISDGAAGGADTCTDTGKILNLTQSYASASGAVLSINNSGSGADILGTSSTWNVTKAGAATFVGVNSGSGLLQGTGGLTVTGTTNINATGTAATNLGNSTGVLTVASGGSSGWTNTSGTLALATATSGDITATTGAAAGLVNVLTGNLKVGNATPDTSLNGEDAFIEGTLEVDSLAGVGTRCVQVAADGTVSPAAAACGTGTVTLQDAYTGGNSIETASNTAVLITETAAAANTGDLLQLTYNAATGGTNAGDALQITMDGVDADSNTGSGLKIIVDQSQNTGSPILVQDDAAVTLFQLNENGGITLGAATAETTAITVTDTDYTNALSIGDNNIIGTTSAIDFTNFDVTSTGDVTAATQIQVGGTANNSARYVNGSFTSSTASLAGVYMDLTNNGSSGQNFGVFGKMTHTGTNSGDYAATGGYFSGVNNNVTAYGVRGTSTNVSNTGGSSSATFLWGDSISATNAGTVSSRFAGSDIDVFNTGTASGVTSGLRVTVRSHSGTMADRRGIDLTGWTSVVAPTNSYGIYADTSIDGGTNKYFIYSTATSSSYMAGNLGLGDTSPAALLTVGTGDLFQVNSSGDILTAAAENLSVTTGTTGSLTLDTGTTGAINIGTGTAGKTISIGTDNTTKDTINIGSALDDVAISSDSWSITNAGAITGATGLVSSGTIQFSALTSNGPLYTSAGNGTLTTTAPTSGAIGYWTRTGTVLSQTTANDTVSLSGNSGDILTVASSATGSVNKALNISQTGAGADYDYAGYFNNTGAATLANIGIYANASGGTDNYAGVFNSGQVLMGGTTNVGFTEKLLVFGSGRIYNGNLNVTSLNTTQTTTSSALSLVGDAITTGTGLYTASSSLTSGKLVDLQVSGTAAAASQTALNILTTGANGTAGITTYGAQIANTHSTNTSTNVALQLSATGGATANYALLVPASSGSVGIGTTAPIAVFDVQGASYSLGGTGDASGNGSTTGFDASTILTYLNGGSITQANYANADINGDGLVSFLDAELIGQYAASAITIPQAQHSVGKYIAGRAISIAYNENVGIGYLTTAPDRKLDVYDASNPQLRLTQADNSVYSDFKMDSNGDLIVVVDGATDQLVLDNGGNVGIGDASPASLFTVGSGDLFQVNSSGDILTAAAENLSVTTGTTGSLTLDTGTTGAINIGTGTAGKTISIGTDNTTKDTINIGSALDDVAISSDSWSITNAGALTVVSCSGCGGGGGALDTLTAATTDDAALTSGDNTIAWDWALTSATSKGFTIGESAASTSGAGDQHILRIDTASTSTAGPLEIVSNSADGGDIEFNLASAGDFEIQDAGTPFVTFTDGGLVQIASAVSTGTTTSSGLSLVANSVNSGTAQYISTTALTSGNALQVQGSGATMTTGGELIDLALGANTVGAGMTITSTGAYTGTGAADGLINVVANALTTGHGSKMSFTGMTSGTGILITGGGANMTAGGELIDLQMGAATVGSGLNITTSGVYTGAGIFQLTANSATTGVIQQVNANGLTSGNAIDVTSSAAANFTGALVDLNLSDGTGASSNTGSLLSLTNSGTANANTALYVKHYATGTGNLALRVDDVSGDTTPFVIDGTGAVGIGDSTPDYTLDVVGNIGVGTGAADGLIVSNVNAGDYISFESSSNSIDFFSNSVNYLTMNGTAAAMYFNGANANIDFYFRGQSDNAMLYADSSANSIGIGTSGPDRKLDVLDASSPQIRLTQADGTVYGDLQSTTTANLIVTGDSLTGSVKEYGLRVAPTVNQSSAAGASYSALDINVTETGTSALNGLNRLADFRASDSSKLAIRNDGSLLLQNAANIVTPYGSLGSFQNHLVRSEAFDNASWIKTSVTAPTADTQTAPDGSTTAESLATSGSGGDVCQWSGTAAGSDTFTFSVWARSTSGTQNFDLRVDAGATSCATANNVTGTAVTHTATTSWQRFTVTQTFSAATGNVKARIFPGGTGGTGTIYAWGAQVDKDSKSNSYAFTTSAALTNVNRGETAVSNFATQSGFTYGGRHIVNLEGAISASSSLVGEFIRVVDNSTGTDDTATVRALEVQSYSGTNINGVNTAIAGFGYTFGVHAVTTAQANESAQPAAVFADLDNGSAPTQGNAIRAYSNNVTSSDLVVLYHESTTFSGNGLEMNFGNSGGGSFTGNFISLQTAGTESFHVDDDGSTFVSLTGATGTDRLCWDGAGGSNEEIVDCTGTPGDLAENFGTSDASIAAGDVVVSSGEATPTMKDGHFTTKAYIAKSTGSYQTTLLGVVSTQPNEVYADDLFTEAENPRPVALVGRVPVKVTTENGAIKSGDYLTSSATQPGKAMKATSSGMVIGQALSSYDGTGDASVIVFVSTGYQSIGNTIVLDAPSAEGQILQSGNENLASNTASTFVIQQQTAEGNGDDAPVSNILQLQTGDSNRFMVSSSGATSILSSMTCELESNECPSVLKVTQANTELMNIDARGTLTLAGTIFIKDDTFAGSVATDVDGLAEITFSYNLGTGKPVVQLTAEAQIPVFAQILEFKQDEEGNYTGFVIKTFDLISGPISATVHYNVTGKQEGYITLGVAQAPDESMYSNFGSGDGSDGTVAGESDGGNGGDGVGLIIEGGQVVGGSGDSSSGGFDDTIETSSDSPADGESIP